MSKLALGILISGRGSNMKALIDACAAPDFPAFVKIVISNVEDAPGLAVAQSARIATHVIPHGKNRALFEDALADALRGCDLICLAGFMRILSPHFFDVCATPVINIHPALLPRHKGLNTHEAVLAANDTEHGCTVHYVTPELDAGETILQKCVPVLPGDTAETLAARVLIEEHKAYPEAVRTIAARV